MLASPSRTVCSTDLPDHSASGCHRMFYWGEICTINQCLDAQRFDQAQTLKRNLDTKIQNSDVIVSTVTGIKTINNDDNNDNSPVTTL